MSDNIIELRKEIKKQNRLQLFTSEKKNNYLYDALSQNIFPINNTCCNFIFTDNWIPANKNEEIQISQILNKLSQWKDKHSFSRLPETHLTINFSNKCNLNCTYCYRHKNNKNVMSLEKTFEVLEYTDKYFKINNDEIIFSIDMTAEALLDSDKIIALDDKFAEYENLYIDENEILKGTYSEFLELIQKDLYTSNAISFSGNPKEDFKSIVLDEKLYSRFKEKKKIEEILKKGNYNPDFLDKKRLLRLNRELLETFYPEFLKHKDYQQFRLWFMSNGANLSDKDIELIKKIRIDPFWISLDGPEEVHDKNRMYYDGQGSHKDVVQSIRLLQENNINVKISCVLTSDYPNPDKLYGYFKTLKISAIQMCPIRNGDKKSFTEKNVNFLINGYKRLYDIIFEEVKNNDFTAFTLLKEDLSMLALSNLFYRIRQSGRCTWGSEVVLDEEGNMYPCLYVIGDKEYCLGNIKEKKSSKELLKPILVNQMDKCSSCWARYICGGTCHYNSLKSNKSVFEPDDIECQIRKFVIIESINLLIKLIENHVDMKKIAATLIQN
ncbi:MAG: SPASM domain-containing protein [Treponema sp.]|nr:SPASM domain-containing protein [Treponema sp.]